MNEPRDTDLVVVHRASSPAAAGIVRAILEDAGILVYIPDRHAAFPVDLTPLDGEHATAGCEVQVPASEVSRAREALEEARAAGRLEDEEPSGSPPPGSP